MNNRTVKIRRGKRTDFPALLEFFPPTARGETTKASMRHWRRLASDLQHDFYVAEREGVILGIVLVSYVRDLRHYGWQAILDLVVSPCSACHIGHELLTFAKTRARKRGCRNLVLCSLHHREQDELAPLAKAGFQRIGDMFSCDLH